MKTVQFRKHVWLPIGALLFITVLLSGCLKEGASATSTTAPEAYVSIMHLSNKAPAVDIYFNTTKASSAALASGSVTSSYSALSPSIFSVTFKKTGADSVVATIPADTYDSLRYYTLLLYDADSVTKAVKITDDYSVLSANSAIYRFWHMSSAIGAVDLYLGSTKIESGRSYADNINATYYDQFFNVTPNTYDIYVKKAGADSVIASTTGVYMSAANAYTIYLKGTPGGQGTNALSVGVLQSAD